PPQASEVQIVLLPNPSPPTSVKVNNRVAFDNLWRKPPGLQRVRQPVSSAPLAEPKRAGLINAKTLVTAALAIAFVPLAGLAAPGPGTNWHIDTAVNILGLLMMMFSFVYGRHSWIRGHRDLLVISIVRGMLLLLGYMLLIYSPEVHAATMSSVDHGSLYALVAIAVLIGVAGALFFLTPYPFRWIRHLQCAFKSNEELYQVAYSRLEKIDPKLFELLQSVKDHLHEPWTREFLIQIALMTDAQLREA